METQHDESKDKSDEAKAKLKSVRTPHPFYLTFTYFFYLQKQDADREGGEAIRRASMQTLRKRARSPSTSSDEGDYTDTEQPTADVPTAPSGPPRATDSEVTVPIAPTTEPTTTAISASSSLETLDSDAEGNIKANEKKKSKRRRTMDRRTSSTAGSDQLVSLLREENARRAAHDAQMAVSFSTFVKDAREQKSEVTSLLRDLFNLAERDL
jgi:hypothetical protein